MHLQIFFVFCNLNDYKEIIISLSECNGSARLSRALCKFNECQNLLCWLDQTYSPDFKRAGLAPWQEKAAFVSNIWQMFLEEERVFIKRETDSALPVKKSMKTVH